MSIDRCPVPIHATGRRTAPAVPDPNACQPRPRHATRGEGMPEWTLRAENRVYAYGPLAANRGPPRSGVSPATPPPVLPDLGIASPGSPVTPFQDLRKRTPSLDA